MRKTIVTALVTLLVMLAVVSCDSIITGKPEYTEDGQQLVTLSVSTSETAGSRSLTSLLAKAEANYMEVIFKTGSGGSTKYYRAAGYYGSGLKIKIPVGSYAAADAVLLIGRNSDTTLLAVGALTNAPVSVAIGTTTIPFTVASLVTDISTNANNTTGFSINEGSIVPTLPAGFSGKTNAGSYESKACFQVPTGSTAINASLAITGFSATTTGLSVIVTSITAPVIFNKIGSAPAISPTITTPSASGTAIGSGTIAFTFAAPTAGFYIITFDIPVIGFAAAVGGTTWHIRGGTKLEGQVEYTTAGGDEGVALLVTSDPTEQTAYVGISPITW